MEPAETESTLASPEVKLTSTENDIIIARILQEEFDFEYEVTKRAMAGNSAGSEFSLQGLLPKLGSFLSLNEGSKVRIKSANVPKCFSFYSKPQSDDSGAESMQSEDLISVDSEIDNDNFVALLTSEPKFSAFHQDLRRFIQEFVSLEVDMLDQIQVINEFFERIEASVERLPLQSDSVGTFQRMSQVLVMNKIYYRIFELEQDGQRSESLSEAIKKHVWIQPEHLDLPPQYAVHEQLIARAIDALIRIDSLKSPSEKLTALGEASRAAFQIITSDPAKRERGAATDDFLPLLIYLILKAQPSRLYSNVQYVARFKRKESPEDRYFFTTLLAAISFIQDLSQKSLSISKEEYTRLTEPNEEPLFEIEGMRIKNIFKKPFNSFSKWIDREFNGKPDESVEEKERQQLSMAIELSLQDA